jgi:hypothetical protein
MFEKNKVVDFRRLNDLNMQEHFLFVSSFEHVNFEINGKYPKKNDDNPKYLSSLVIFQTYKTPIKE